MTFPKPLASATGRVLAAVLFVPLLAACESSVAPRADSDRHFSLYGVLNPRADSQAVLVFPIEDELRALPTEPLDATLVSRELSSGQEIAWADSILTTAEGAVHVYWARFRAEHDRTYRIDVQNSRGDRGSQVTVRVPPEAEIVPRDVVDGLWVTQDVDVTAAVERLNFLKVQYVIKAKLPPSSLAYPVLLPDKLPDLFSPPPPTDPQPPPPPEDTLIVQTLFVPIDYAEKATPSASGWTMPINFSDDFREIRRRVSTRGNADPIYGIQLKAIEVSMVAANAAWQAPENQFNSEVLIQPGTMTNVERGFGFVGAGYRLEHSYTIPDDMLIRIGFRLPTDD